MYQQNSITVIIPAHNEASSIKQVVKELFDLRDKNNAAIIDDIIVCDNASTDNTQTLAAEAGARVIYEAKPGYGAACLAAMSLITKADIVLFVDGDASVKTHEVFILLDEVISDVDLAIGARVKQQQEQDALFLQQSIGNLLITRCIQWIWHQPITDLGPFRAIKYPCLLSLNMQDQRFGWTVEMQVKAFQQALFVKECPVSTKKRIGKSKISGTLKGTLYAGFDMFKTIMKLRMKEKRIKDNLYTLTKHFRFNQ